jgi:hypothetical protein
MKKITRTTLAIGLAAGILTLTAHAQLIEDHAGGLNGLHHLDLAVL